jgi:addiction module RelE/StbE family toxin
MRLLWTREAVRAREAIYDHIEASDPSAALAMDTLFSAAAARLREHPHLGRNGRLPGSRELVVHPHYVLAYDIKGDVIRILHLLHTSRQWPPER